MSKLLKMLLDSLMQFLKSSMSQDSYDIKHQLKVLNNLLNNIEEIYIIVDLYDFVYRNGDVDVRSKEIRIGDCNKYTLEISKLLENIPKAKIRSHLSAIHIMYISCDIENVESIIRKDKAKIYKPIIDNLVEIIKFYNSNDAREGFVGLLNKYEDTFATLNSTIIELKDNSLINYHHKETVRNILQTFIDEFNSLKQAHGARENLDREATKDSIARRLEDELDFVNRIKTDWNSSAL